MDERAVLNVKYNLSDAYRQERCVATGWLPKKNQSAELNMLEASPEQRAAILRLAGMGLELDMTHYDYPEYAGEPTPEQLAADCERLADEKEAAERKSLAKEIAQRAEWIGDGIERGDPQLSYHVKISEAERKAAARLGVDLGEYDAARARYDAVQPELKRRADEARADKERIEAEMAERKRAEADAARAEKAAWVEAHGSDYLKRACAAGHNCQRLYVKERAGQEAPNYVVDFDNNAEWRERSCPSLTALNELDKVAQLQIGEPEIVWLEAEPHDKNNEEPEYGFEECEAVVIRSYLGKYDLVKLI